MSGSSDSDSPRSRGVPLTGTMLQPITLATSGTLWQCKRLLLGGGGFFHRVSLGALFILPIFVVEHYRAPPHSWGISARHWIQQSIQQSIQ
jgi:hypothetical protein